MTEEQKKEMDRLMAGQIWEGCECCGEEPVYLPTMLCETCIKKVVTGKGTPRAKRQIARRMSW